MAGGFSRSPADTKFTALGTRLPVTFAFRLLFPPHLDRNNHTSSLGTSNHTNVIAGRSVEDFDA